ncbi:MAG: hypothetical protein AB7E47_15555 [Desulfovibrionaceae bacterium]
MSTPEEMEAAKRAMYEQMAPRRRKFIDKIGYENWEPFAEPKHPIEMRTDPSKRTAHQLVREFLSDMNARHESGNHGPVALECALALLRGDEQFRITFDFCVWYAKLLEKEGVRLDEA